MRIIFALSVVAGASIALIAQTNPPAMPGAEPPLVSSPTNAPAEVRATEIQADGFKFFMKSNVVVYSGDVRVDNPQMKITCELLTIEAPKLTNRNEFNRATAETNVIIDWMDERGPNHSTSGKAVYTKVITNLAAVGTPPRFETNATVVLMGNPVVTNTSGTFVGDPINWDRISGVISSPNMHHMTVLQGQTNSLNLFDASAPKPPKTNAPPK